MTDVLPCPCSSAPEAPALLCGPVRGAAELAQHHRIRCEVFVDEQRLFVADDRDEHDDDARTVHVLGLVGQQPAGAVRLHPLGNGLWKGDRLAVRREHRRSGIGGPLVRTAVATAGARGGSGMVAQVQAVHTGFFVQLGWTPVGRPFDLLGLPHQQMAIRLHP